MLSTTEQEFLVVLAEGGLNKDTYLYSQGVITHLQPKTSEEASLFN